MFLTLRSFRLCSPQAALESLSLTEVMRSATLVSGHHIYEPPDQEEAGRRVDQDMALEAHREHVSHSRRVACLVSISHVQFAVYYVLLAGAPLET